MPERIINLVILFTLALLAFTLVAVGFEWIYQLWLAERLGTGWMVPVLAIPVVAVLSALLLFFFCNAIGLDEGGEGIYPYD